MKTKLLSLIILFVSTLVMGQDSTLVGSVVDSNTDGPLPGVSVVIKGTQSGTTTDFDGNFSLSGVESGDVIQFSYIGYVTQEIEVGTSFNLSVSLQEDVEALEKLYLLDTVHRKLLIFLDLLLQFQVMTSKN